jgi:hypothetical protein
VDVKTYKNIAAVLCVTALAIPAGVAAKGPSGIHGKSDEPHGQNQEPKHADNRCKQQPNVGFSIRGTLDPSSTANNIIVVVTSANKHAKPFVTAGKYTVPAGSTVEFEGSNPFTTTGADFTKYGVKVNGKVIKTKKGCVAENPPAPTIKKVKIHAPDATPEQTAPKS